ncbi:MAG: ABC transporter permease [Chloroflexi bacterium]|nr:ABC transporter permease [Chloroflexota bacterium]
MKRIDHNGPTPQQPYVTRAAGRAWEITKARPLALSCTAVLLVMATAALLADFVAPRDPLAQDIAGRLLPPGNDHLFGTDGFGRDVFSRVVHGARASLFVSALAVGMAAAAGICSGMFSAYWGGKLDLLLQRAVDVLLGLPYLVLAIIMVVALGPSWVSVAFAIALALAPQIARLSRASALSTREEPYVDAARAMGASSFHTIWKHVLPNSLPPVLAQVSGYFGTAVAAETALSFLALGIPPPYPAWGRMLQEGVRQYFEAAPWATVFPGLALSATVAGAALLGEEIRDLLDPRRSRSRRG